jgi:polyhydroxyalkanoate synthesis regulator phasin
MLNLLEQGFYLGLGAVSLTATKAEEAVKSVVAKAGLSTEDGQKLSEKLIDEGKQARANLQSRIEEVIKKGQAIIPLTNSISQLEKRIEELEQKLADKCEEAAE